MSTALEETYQGNRLHVVRKGDTIAVKPSKHFVPVAPGTNSTPSEVAEPSEFLSLARKMDSGTITPDVFKSRDIQDLEHVESEAITDTFESIIDTHKKFDEVKRALVELFPEQERSGLAREELNALSKALNAETPHTHHEDERLALLQQNFVKFTQALSSEPESSKPIIFFQDIFQINGHTVVRHGINPDNEFMTRNISKFNTSLERFNSSSSTISRDSAALADQSDTASVASSRSRPLSKKGVTSYTKETLLHPAELYNLHKAINSLISTEGPHAVVVDILVRDLKSCLINEKSDANHAEIHAIVLYKNHTGDIIVIDPNNSDYSLHVAASYNSIVLCTHDNQFKIGAPKTQLKIFANPTSDTIINDCVDIAAKIAADLIAKQPTLTPVTDLCAEQLELLFTKILAIPEEFNLHIPGGTRILITSDEAVRNDAHTHVGSIIGMLKVIEQQSKTKDSKCAKDQDHKTKLATILLEANKDYEYSQCIKRLDTLQQEVSCTLREILNPSHVTESSSLGGDIAAPCNTQTE